MQPIKVFDARIITGRDFLAPAECDSLKETMRKADAERCIFFSRELSWLPPQRSMPLVRERAARVPGSWGLYLLMSSLTGEMPPVEELAPTLRRDKIAGFTIHPAEYTTPLEPILFRRELSAVESLGIPLFFHKDGRNPIEFLYKILEKHPGLNVVLSVDEEWPNARKLYPILDVYPGLRIALSEHVWMGAIEDITARFGEQRLVYSSSYPRRYAGGSIAMVMNADLTDAQKQKIFSGNLEDVLGGLPE